MARVTKKATKKKATKKAAKKGTVKKTRATTTTTTEAPKFAPLAKPTVKLGKQQRGSDYIHELRRDYSMYVMQMRAIIAESDGLKSAGRRLLWVARDGSTYKSMNLAAATAPYHPHTSPEGTIDTLTAQFINNTPLFEGIQSFGTFVEPKAFSASRYTDVKLSKFTKDIMFADSAIIPMVPNYDQTREEPLHFLPLVPVSLLNPSEGIAVGFSSNILPRKLSDVVEQQIAYLSGKKIKNVAPCSEPIDSTSTGEVDGKWEFEGEFERTAHNIVRITKLPYGLSYEKMMDTLDKLKDSDLIVDIVDDCVESIDIKVTFKRGALATHSDAELLKLFKLTTKHAERMIMVSFSGNTVVERTFETAISSFCDWRLAWYLDRYEYRETQYSIELQYVIDYLLTVDSGTAEKFTKEKSKVDLELTLRKIGVVNDEKIARLPAYAFTKAEYDKMKARKKELEDLIKDCDAHIKSEALRKDRYLDDLKAIQKDVKAGKYATPY